MSAAKAPYEDRSMRAPRHRPPVVDAHVHFWEPGTLRYPWLDALPSLELLALTGRNSGHVDVAAASARGILVTETEGSGTSAIEHTIALLLALVRRIPREDRAMRQGGWQTGVAVELAGKTLGIVGLGRIGSRVAAFGKLLEMRVLAWGPMVWIGRRSYAMYMLHIPVWVFVVHFGLGRTGSGDITWMSWLAIGVTFAISELSFRFVETPALALKRRFGAAR